MEYSLDYRSTRPVSEADTDAIKRDATAACHGRSWLSCEPVWLYRDPEDGFLAGSSKPNFLPHADDVADAAKSELPDGTTRDVIEILCGLSRDHGVDWEFTDAYTPGPIGKITKGVCDDTVIAHAELCGSLGEALMGDLTEFGIEDI